MFALRTYCPAWKFTAKGAGSVLLVLTALSGLWFLAAGAHRRSATAEIGRSLTAINSRKAAEIANWREEHSLEAARLSRHPFLGGIISEEAAFPGSRRAQLRAWCADYIKQERYDSMAFLSLKGAIIAATPGYAAGTEKTFIEAFGKAALGTPLLTDLYLSANGRPRLTMLSPVFAGEKRGGKPLCVLVTEIDPEAEFYPLLKASPLLVPTAETLLVRKEGESVLYLNELEHRKDSALKLLLPLSDKHLPAAAALSGRKDFFEGFDYRGVRVFSAGSPVAGSNWAIVTKIDRDVLLAPVNTREYLSLALLLLAGGLVYGGFLAVYTARKRADADALKASNDRLSLALEVGKAGIWEWDRQSGKVFFDDRFHAMLGYKPGELPSGIEEWLTYHHRGDMAAWQAKAEDYLKGAAPVYESEHRIRGKAGAWEWVFTRGRLAPPSEAGAPGLFTGIAMNITERKLLELEKDRLSFSMEERKKDMENFLYITTHDLRGPLINIQGFAGELDAYCKELRETAAPAPGGAKNRELELTAECIPEALEIINTSAVKMSGMLDVLLKMSRLGRMELRAEKVDMNAALKIVLGSLVYQLERAGGAVTAGPLPPCTADPAIVGQVLTNLLDNALKYRDRSRKPEIAVSGELKDGKTALYTVSDNGLGIRAADLSQIWRLFYRGHTREPGVEKGEGIGLTMTKRMVEKSGGSIRAESKEGAGTKFFIELPAFIEG